MCVCVCVFISVIVDEKIYKDYLYSNGEFCYLKKLFFCKIHRNKLNTKTLSLF